MINKAIVEISEKVVALFQSERARFSGISATDLHDFIHQADDFSHSADYSKRVAAEFIRTACVLELEK